MSTPYHNHRKQIHHAKIVNQLCDFFITKIMRQGQKYHDIHITSRPPPHF